MTTANGGSSSATSSGTSGNKNGVSNWGEGLSQLDLMEKDTVLVVDDDDNIVGSAKKADSHVFSEKQPHGVLHRAFSVFLFDKKTNKLLLQKRASHKITFPNVWTNTCCSHPLFGMEPNEVDDPSKVRDGTVPGVKNAAVRKLGHELGIPPDQIDTSDMKFLTRMHYWAADTVTHGPNSPWGEHEIDHALVWVVDDATDNDNNSNNKLEIKGNPDEVDDVKWVSPDELRSMLDDPDLLFSPWFRLICQRWLLSSSEDGNGNNWWSDLKRTMDTDDFCDYGTIHRFDPPREHWGGAGNAQPRFLQKGGGAGTAAGDARYVTCDLFC